MLRDHIDLNLIRKPLHELSKLSARTLICGHQSRIAAKLSDGLVDFGTLSGLLFT